MPISTALVATAKSAATALWIASRSRAGTDAGTPPDDWPTDPLAAASAAEAGSPSPVNEVVSRCVSTVVRGVTRKRAPAAAVSRE